MEHLRQYWEQGRWLLFPHPEDIEILLKAYKEPRRRLSRSSNIYKVNYHLIRQRSIC
jgi:hypothetical protein